MKKLIFCALLAAAVARADYTSVAFESLGACVHARFEADAVSGTTALFIDEDSDTTDGVRTRNYSNNANRGNLQLCGLREAVKYYLTISTQHHGPLVCESVCTDCDFGPGVSSGFNCDAVGEPPNFTADASFGPGPTPPISPVHSFNPDEICEAVPSTTRTLTCEDGVAVDWLEKWDEARASDSDLIHEILIPSGCVVREPGRILFEDWTGPGGQTGGVVIRTAGDAKLFPPAGVRTDPTYGPLLGGFSVAANRTMFGDSPAFVPMAFRSNSSDVCFQNIKFELPPAEQTNRAFRIVDVSGENNDVLTVSEPLGLDQHDTDNVVIDFDDCDGLQGAKNAFDANALGNTIRISGGPYQPKGPCQSGRVVFFTGVKIASIEDTTPIRLNFTSEHAFYDLEDLDIESITDNQDGTSTLELAEPMHLTRSQALYVIAHDVVRVTGSGGELDDQLLEVISSTLTSIQVPGGASCTGGCGSVREHHTIMIRGAAIPSIDGGRHYRKVDLDTIELLGTQALGAGGAGGYAVHDSETPDLLITLSNNQSRIAFDRVLGNCGQFPYRIPGCLNFAGANGVSVANSFFVGPSRHFPIDPVSKRIRDSVEPSSNSGSLFLRYNSAQDVQLRNIAVGETHGIVFGGDSSCQTPLTDLTVQRVHAEKPNRMMAGHPESNDAYYNDRHILELKCGERILIEGLYAAGSWADGTPSAPAVIFKASGGGGLFESYATRDIDIRGLHVARSVSGVHFLQGAITARAPPIQRISVTDSLFEELDYDQYASQPSQITGPAKANCCNFAGNWIQLSGDQSDIRIANNTLGEQRCRGIGCLMSIGSGFQTRLVLEDNVLSFSKNPSSFGVKHQGNGQGAYVPACEALAGGQDVWECQVHQILANGTHTPDAFSAFRNNVVYGGLENMWVGKDVFDQKALSSLDSDTVTDLETEAYFAGWTTGQSYPAGASMADRVNAAFKPGTWESTAPGKGFDRRQFMAYRGLIADVDVNDLGGGVARVSYEGPESGDLSPEQCWVDYSLDPAFGEGWWSSGGRIADGGLSGPRTVDLVGLESGALYHWRLLCPASQTRGQFKTEAPAP